MKKNKKKIILFLLILSLLMTSGTFAYWANYIEGTKEEAVGVLEVGSGTMVTTVFELANSESTGGLLVPENHVINSGDFAVDSVTLTHTLSWNENNSTSQLEGTSTTGLVGVQHRVIITQDDSNLPTDEYFKVYDLINVEYGEDNPTLLTLNGNKESFVYEVTLDEPSDQETYNLIANSIVSIEFYYIIASENISVTDIENTSITIQTTSEEYFKIKSSEPSIIYYYDIEGGLDVNIPNNINNVDITEIGDNAFLRKGINTVVIPANVTYIGTNAFHSNNLKTVVIPGSVELISYNAFYGNNLKTVTFEEGLEVIRQGAFADNFLTSITLPDSVKVVHEGAFGYGGNFITQITLGDDVEIGNSTSFGWYGDSFRKLYNEEKIGGTYHYINGEWIKQ